MASLEQDLRQLSEQKYTLEQSIVNTLRTLGVKVVNKKNYDPEKLNGWIHTCQAEYTSKPDFYSDVIEEAIEQSNIHALKLLWDGIHEFGNEEARPDYDVDLQCAASCADLNTFKHVLDAYTNNIWYGEELCSVGYLAASANSNPHPEVKKFILTLGDPSYVLPSR